VLAAGHAPSEVGLIDPNSLGVGFTVDGIIANSNWLKSAQNQRTAVRFLRASIRGAIYCRDHPSACVGLTLKVAPQLCRPLQNWMMNEINKSMWPSPAKIGYISPTVFKSGGAILRQYGGLKSPPDRKSIRTDLWTKAIAGLKNTTGKNFKPQTLGPRDVSGC
jgi:NitT/TauT family transport system substrate-binding protein